MSSSSAYRNGCRSSGEGTEWGEGGLFVLRVKTGGRMTFVMLSIKCLLLLVIEMVAGYSPGQGPTFTQQPPSRIVFSNTSGSQVSCSASGSPAPSVAWTMADGSAVSAVPGLRQMVGNGTLYFPPFLAEDYRPEVHDTEYRCRAENTLGAALSRIVRVKGVVVQPYEVQVTRSHAMVGNVAMLSCVIPTHVMDYVTVTSWYNDDHVLLPGRKDIGQRHIVTSGRGDLYIRDVREEDALSRFSCVTTNSLTGERKRSTPTTLMITVPNGSMHPRLVHKATTDATAERGADVHLSCVAQGIPPPKYIWYRSVGNVLMVVPHSQRVSPGEGLMHIEHVEAVDAGSWLCEAQNEFGSQRIEVDLHVTEELNVNIEPKLQIIHTGGSAIFNCTTSGSPIVVIEWLHNAEKIDPMESARIHLLGAEVLKVTSVTRADRGVYQCVVRNERDSATASAELHLGDTSPELISTFLEQVLRPGLPASLRCTATGSPPPQFNWLLDGHPLSDMNAHRYAIGQYMAATGDVISYMNISSVRSEDGGHYSCLARNNVGAVSHHARVNVYGPPYIRSVPPIRAAAGNNVTLYCPYSGYPIDAVRWERLGQDVPNNERQHLKDSSHGSILHISQVDADQDAGGYMCSVTSRMGQVVRREVSLEVLSPPAIQSFSFPQNLRQGDRTQAVCSSKGGDMPIYFSWLKDGMPISPSLQIEERPADFFTMLVFKNVSYRHNGEYTCVAANNAAKVSFSSKLMVKVPPQWTSEPSQDIFILMGSSVVVDCAASGFPTPRIQWSRGKGSDPSIYEPMIHSQSNLRILSNGSLNIQMSNTSDEGTYRCEVTNGVGASLSKVIYIHVNEPARFEFPSKNVSARRGDSVTFSCDVLGDNPIDVTWTHNDHRLEINTYRLSVSDTRSSTGLTSQVMLSQGDRDDSGIYKCHAENKYGRGDFLIYLSIQEPPDAPSFLEVVEIGGRLVRLVWKRAFDGNSPVLSYVIQYQPLSASGVAVMNWTNYSVRNMTVPSSSTIRLGEGPRETTIVGDLHPDTPYAFRMLAVNEIANSFFTEVVVARTQEEAPSEAPSGLQVTTGGPGELLLTWQVPPRDSWNGNLLGYTIQYTEQFPTAKNGSRLVTVEGWASTKLQMTGLKKFTRYELQVRAFNAVSAGPNSVPVLASTMEGVPEAPPTEVSCRVLSSQSVQVSWTPPSADQIGGVLQGYKVMYRPMYDEYVDYRNVENVTPAGEVKRTTGIETYLHALEKYTNYSLRVLAYTTAGDGVNSKAIFCRTEEDVPGPPENLKALALTGDSVLVSWLAPTHPNGLVFQYTVYSRAAGRVGNHITHLVRVDPSVRPMEVTAEVRSLVEHQLYEFWVSASTSVGEGEPTVVVAQATNTRAPARIASFSRAMHPSVGTRLLLTCIAVGNPTPRSRWLNKGRPITSSPFYQVTDEGHLIIHSVDVNISGNYSCTAKNLFGEDEVTYVIRALLPPSQPVVELQYVTSNSIKVLWNHPFDGGTPILRYVLSFRRETEMWTNRELSHERTSYNFDELNCGSPYSLYLVAYNKVGIGTPSETITMRTKGGLPSAPDQKNFLISNSTFIKVRLRYWRDEDCPVRHFSVEYRHLGQSRWVLIATDTPEQELLVSDLEPASWYQLRISATNDAGTTTGSFNIATTTLGGVHILPPVAFPSDANILENEVALADYNIVWTAVSATVLVLCGIILLSLVRRRKTLHHGYGQGGKLDDKQHTEQDNIQHQRNTQSSRQSQQAYIATSVKQFENEKGVEEAEMYEISPYATFSVSGPGSRAVTASTLDYTLQLKAYGMLEDEAVPDHMLSRITPAEHSWERHRLCNDEEYTLSKSLTLPAVDANKTRTQKTHQGTSKDSESDTSGSPCQEFYVDPVKPPRDKFRFDSSTESNNGFSPLTSRHAQRHLQRTYVSSR